MNTPAYLKLVEEMVAVASRNVDWCDAPSFVQAARHAAEVMIDAEALRNQLRQEAEGTMH